MLYREGYLDEQITKKLEDLFFEGLSDLDTSNEQFRLNVRDGIRSLLPLFKFILEQYFIDDPSEIDSNKVLRRNTMSAVNLVKPLFKYGLELLE